MAANPQPAPEPKRRNTVPTEKMRLLYFDEGLRLAKVGKLVGLTGQAVKHRLVQAGFKLRSHPKPPAVSTEDLHRLYADEGLSLGKVSKQVGLSISTVRKRLLRDGCVLRQRRKISRTEEVGLIAAYTQEKLTIDDLVRRSGFAFSTIQRCLQNARVSRRRGYALDAVWAKRKAREALSGKPAWMQVAGNYLLDHPEATNEDVAKHLDRKAKRSDRKRWIDLVNSQSAKNDFGDVRRLVGIRGRVPGKK